ncbi:hypothetical protein QYE76_010795 [Lolium multiflorum]|uniref:Uncharacterized protein n=1 Tax=Lolium multiflorum TaxID=4521 RepID=A0AAD8X285_LOLMU|nr:hypothetical protein QYE76_010795 [Lolium multiflorum]
MPGQEQVKGERRPSCLDPNERPGRKENRIAENSGFSGRRYGGVRPYHLPGYVRTTCPYRTINIMDEFCQISREFNGHCAMSFFRKSSSGGVDGSSSQHDPRKKARKIKEVLETDFDEEYNRLSGRKVLPTKWVDSGFLTSNVLDSDYTMMVRNAGMEVFSALNCGTYKRAKLEFLATFHDDLASCHPWATYHFEFLLNNTPHCLTFGEFCGCFGFSTTGDEGAPRQCPPIGA